MDNLAYLLMKVARHLKNTLDKTLQEYDVTAAQFSVLNQIACKNGVITSAEVADRLSSDRPTISGIINRLEEKDLVVKVLNPEDKRSVYLKLSQDALRLIEELRITSNQLCGELFSDFTAHDVDKFRDYLLKLIEKVELL